MSLRPAYKKLLKQMKHAFTKVQWQEQGPTVLERKESWFWELVSVGLDKTSTLLEAQVLAKDWHAYFSLWDPFYSS